jgi:hypothetical protein
MKTWKELEMLADEDRLEIKLHHGGVEIWTRCALATPFVRITPHDLVDEDADIVVRAACAAALTALRELPR